MPRPTLPPLPAASLLAKPHLFPRKLYPQSADPMARSMPGRQLIADPELADSFVQALDLREGEVVIECFPGHGQVTRSLLRGGRARDGEKADGRGGEWGEWEAWRRHLEEGEGNGEGSAGREAMRADKGKEKEKAAHPAWTSADMDNAVEVKGSKGAASNADVPAGNGESSASISISPSSSWTTSDRSFHTPPVVVAVEPSYTLLTRALGPAEELAALTAAPVAAPTPAPAPQSSSPSNPPTTQAPPAQGSSIKTPVNQSIHHPNLILSNSTAYAWHTLPDILSDPLVAPHISRRAWSDVPAAATAVAEAEEATFDADEVQRIPIASQQDRAEAAHPPYTIVAHIPNSTGGEQMVSQWIGSAVGSEDAEAEGSRQWIWRWGRARLAMVVPKNLYDVSLAPPRGRPIAMWDRML